MSTERGSVMNCLRCRDQALTRLDAHSSASSTFFECPLCGRHYTLMAGRALTFRWRHPISVALYEFSFRSGSAEGFVASTAAAMEKNRTPKQIDAVIQEFELELNEPTQQIRDIISSPRTEEECRAFIAEVAALMRARRQAP